MLAAESAGLGLFVFVIWLANSQWTASAAVGGLVFVVSNTYFTLYTLPFIGNHQNRWFLRAFFRGQTGKLILAAVGFVLAFEFTRPLHIPSLFLGFCLMMIVHLVVAARMSAALGDSAQYKEN